MVDGWQREKFPEQTSRVLYLQWKPCVTHLQGKWVGFSQHKITIKTRPNQHTHLCLI